MTFLLVSFALIILGAILILLQRRKEEISALPDDDAGPATVEEADHAFNRELITIDWTDKGGNIHKVMMERWQEAAIWNNLSYEQKKLQVKKVPPKHQQEIEIDGKKFMANLPGKSQLAKASKREIAIIKNQEASKGKAFTKAVTQKFIDKKAEEGIVVEDPLETFRKLNPQYYSNK